MAYSFVQFVLIRNTATSRFSTHMITFVIENTLLEKLSKWQAIQQAAACRVGSIERD